MRKKKRTPAQIRATKKLVALNKKRGAEKKSTKRKVNPKRRVVKKRVVKKRVVKKRVVKKRVVKKRVIKRRVAKKRVVKRKVAKRKVNPVSNYGYVIMAQAKKDSRKGYYTGVSFDTSIKRAAIFKSKILAEKTAKKLNISRRAWDLYIVKESINKLK